jgi:serine/threonine-protein kinase HipA
MIDELDVYLNFGDSPIHIGRLAFSIDDQRVLFEYDQSYLGTGFSVSPIQLPLESGLFRADRPKYPDDPRYGLHGVFADSLPDTWGRKVQDLWFQKIGIENPHPFERLAYVGHFGMGALSYEPSMKFADAGRKISDLARLRKAAIDVLQGDVESVTAKLSRIGGSAGGMYPKFLVNFNPRKKSCSYGLAPGKSEIPAIVKVPVSPGEEMQQIEYAYSKMARHAGIDMPPTYLVMVSGAHYYIIQRFDINDDGSRNHVHTMAGMMGINYADRIIDYRQAFRLTNGLTRDKEQMGQLFRRMAFNVLSANRDDHTKNISFIADSKGAWRLSPAYDLVLSQTMDGVHSMSVNGAVTGHSLADFESLAREFGLKNWLPVLDEVKEALQWWPDIADECGIAKKTIAIIHKHIELMCDSVS